MLWRPNDPMTALTRMANLRLGVRESSHAAKGPLALHADAVGVGLILPPPPPSRAIFARDS